MNRAIEPTEMYDGAAVEKQDSRALAVYEEVTPEQARMSLQAIKQFQATVKAEMIQGHDYGTIPGTQKPTLLKPGAEKLAKLLGCSDEYEIMEKREEWDKPFFYYMFKCKLIAMKSGIVISEGIGSANSYEAKWRYRWVFESQIPEGLDKKSLQRKQFKSKAGRTYVQYRVENEDIYSQVNTIQKIAKKRSLVDASLSAGRLSDLFTQDLDEYNGHGDQEDVPEPENAPQESQNAPKTNAGQDSRALVKAQGYLMGLSEFCGLTRKQLDAWWAEAAAAGKLPQVQIGEADEAQLTVATNLFKQENEKAMLVEPLHDIAITMGYKKISDEEFIEKVSFAAGVEFKKWSEVDAQVLAEAIGKLAGGEKDKAETEDFFEKGE